jgi:putative lipoprotein
LETQFLTSLSEADNYKVIDKTLTLYSNVGIALGLFTAQEK